MTVCCLPVEQKRSSTIQTLSPEIINLIAAGEIIDSLAAVVRELVENSLDAGATRIEIGILPEFWWISVADNGKGMSLEDLHYCTNPHSTSKISTSDDLWQIRSLGFRGEALHSILQVADLELFSRLHHDSEDFGWRVVYREGKLVKEEAVAISPGTIAIVNDIFGKLPVRRKGLPTTSQQLKTVQNLIYNIALCHTQVTWQVKLDSKLWFKISGANNSKGILPQILKQTRENDLQLLQSTLATASANLELVIGLPDRIHRRRPDWVKVGINGRIVRSPELEQTILAGFARTLPRNRFPVCFLHLKLSPDYIDWNRHPAKSEVYLQEIKLWQEEISRAVEKSLRLDFSQFDRPADNYRISKLIKVAEAKSSYQIDRHLEEVNNQNRELNFLPLKAVAQLHNTYIVAEHPTGLWLIEQHIAHERVLYEQLQDSWQLVPLETPIVLSDLKTEQIEQLVRLGLEIESFGEQLWAVRNIPEILSSRKDLNDTLLELSWGGDLQTAQVATACRSAIRNGTPLNLIEMQNLLDLWKKTRNPRTCPHGRPIYLSLEETALARFFRRHWVIGKSHGI
jgi:DNA mismatch repair protein MutL